MEVYTLTWVLRNGRTHSLNVGYGYKSLTELTEESGTGVTFV